MSNRRRFILLIAIMSAVGLAIAGITMQTLYAAAIDEGRARLRETAQSHARIIEAIARYNQFAPHTPSTAASPPQPVAKHTLATLRDAHEQFEGFGKTGEFTLARREGDMIVFLLSHRWHDSTNPRPVPFESELAEPMRRALRAESGTVIGLDYRGATVLAAFEPVDMLGWGVVAKIDMAEVRAPFLRAGAIALGLGLLLVISGAVLFLRVGNPLIHQLENNERRLKAELRQREQTEAELRRNRELLDQVGTIARIGGWEHDLVTGEARWTKGTYEIIEIKPGEPIPGPNDHFNYYAPDDRAILQEHYQHAIETGEPFDLELRCHTATGRLFWARAMGAPTFENGRCTIMRGIFQDITKHKQAEEDHDKLEAQLRQAQKMEAVGQLAGGVAHDFNNILTAMFGNVETALREIQAHHPDARTAIDGMQQIEQGAQRAARLTRQLLTFSRRQVIRPEPVNLNTTLLDIEKMLRRLVTEDIDVQLCCAPAVSSVRVDPGQLEQVILNLVINAKDAMRDGGRLLIETRDVTLNERYVATHPEVEPGNYVMLAVSDTGAGMAPEVCERVFEPFFTTKPEGQGTGLGLATVYGIVKQSGGSIACYSETGQGTCFKVYLPTTPDAALPRPRPAEHEAPPTGTETILLCEDDASVRELTAVILREAGYTVLAAAKPGEALQIAAAETGNIHLLLTDVIMPGMNGRKLSDTLTTLRPDIRTLFVSGYTENVIAHHGVLEKNVNFLEKPFSRHQLLQRIREVLDQTPTKPNPEE